MVGVVVADDAADLVTKLGTRFLEELSMPDQGEVIALQGGGAICLGDQVQGQELGQHAGVELVALAGTLGDDPQQTGMGQDDLLGKGLEAFEQPLIAGVGLDDDLEGSGGRRRSRRCDRLRRRRPTSLEHVSALIDDADCDTDCLWRSKPTNLMAVLRTRENEIGETLKVYHTLRVAAVGSTSFIVSPITPWPGARVRPGRRDRPGSPGSRPGRGGNPGRGVHRRRHRAAGGATGRGSQTDAGPVRSIA